MIEWGRRPGKVEPQRIDPELEAARQDILEPVAPMHYRTLRQLASNPDNYFVLSLGGGSAPALAGNAAMTVLLEELELRPLIREIWGTSAGAILGGCWATGTPSGQMLETLLDMNRRGIVDVSRWLVVMRDLPRLVFRRKFPEGFISGKHFLEYTARGLRVENIEECEIPFRVIACRDDGSGRKVIFREGPLLRAIAASFCLPGVMQPVPDWGGGEFGYFDGGIVEKTPLMSIIEEHARQLRPQRLCVLCTHFMNAARSARPHGFIQRFMNSNDVMEDLVWNAQLEQARAGQGRFLVASPDLRQGAYFDFSRIENNYLVARQAFKHQLSNAGLPARFDAR